MPLVTANALSFTRALWVAPLAVIFLREKAGLWRVGAVLMGFAGVLMMLGPALAHGIDLGLPALAMLISALLTAVTILGIKAAAKDTSPTVLMVWSTVLGTALLLPGAILTWRWPGALDLAMLSATGAVGLAGQGMYIKAMHVGDAAAMAPLDYLRLIFSAAVGFAFFHEVPTVWVVAGAGVVVASTLIITLREQQVARQARRRITEAEIQAEGAEI